MTTALSLMPKTDDELRQLAQDFADGKAFCNWHVPPADEMLIPRIFLPMAAMTPTERDAFLTTPPGCIYQYRGVDEAPIRVRGYPVFTSYRTLSVDEWNWMVPMVKALRARYLPQSPREVSE